MPSSLQVFHDCQARSINKFQCRVNTALSTVNVAKIEQVFANSLYQWLM